MRPAPQIDGGVDQDLGHRRAVPGSLDHDRPVAVGLPPQPEVDPVVDDEVEAHGPHLEVEPVGKCSRNRPGRRPRTGGPAPVRALRRMWHCGATGISARSPEGESDDEVEQYGTEPRQRHGGGGGGHHVLLPPCFGRRRPCRRTPEYRHSLSANTLQAMKKTTVCSFELLYDGDMIATMEALLGLPPMNNNDAQAPVMASLFSGAGQQPAFIADYRNRANKLIYEMNSADAPGANESKKMNFSHADAVNPEKLNAILWRARKGSAPLPQRRSSIRESNP